MAASPQYPVVQPPPSRWGAGRVIALVCGVLLLLPGIGLLAGGGVLLWADRFGRDDAGYLSSASRTVTSPGYALSSGQVDLTTGANWVPLSATLGTARIDVTRSGAGGEVFVGIAPVDAGTAYLAGVQHTVVDDFGTNGTGQVL